MDVKNLMIKLVNKQPFLFELKKKYFNVEVLVDCKYIS